MAYSKCEGRFMSLNVLYHVDPNYWKVKILLYATRRIVVLLLIISRWWMNPKSANAPTKSLLMTSMERPGADRQDVI